MRDPHVKELTYELKPGERVKYENPPPVELQREGYRLELDEGVLHVEMLQHCSRVAEAQGLVEPFLKAWATHALLENGRDCLRFEYKGSKVVDRGRSDPDAPQDVHLSSSLKVDMKAWTTKLKGEYPAPPPYGNLSVNADTMAFRYRCYREGREPLLAMAYFCLTVIEAKAEVELEMEAKKRKKAASHYNISWGLLNDLGTLTTKHGDEQTARKYHPKLKPLSDDEQKWVDRAVRRIIQQVAAVEAKQDPGQLTKGDLPRLP